VLPNLICDLFHHFARVLVIGQRHEFSSGHGPGMGTLIHGLLEHAMSQKKATAEDLHGLGIGNVVDG